MEDAFAKGRKNLGNFLDEAASKKVLRKNVEAFIEYRKKLKALDKAQLLNKFKNAFEVKHFDNLASFYDDIIKKYPKLKGGLDEIGVFRQMNLAEFKTVLKSSDGRKIEELVELVHSGEVDIYDDFIKAFDKNDTISRRFLKGIVNKNNNSKRNDSEIKFIYNFLKNHFNKADEFIIETKNIYFTCDSCQRELLMLKAFVESQGKKMTLIVHGVETIKNGPDLSKYLN